MKNVLLLLCLFALSPRLPTAQDAKTAVAPEKVTYSRAIPKSLFAFVPRGGKSRFWGATKLKYNGQQVWVHVYDVEKIKYKKTEEYETDIPKIQKSGVDLFIFSKSHRLQRVTSLRFDYQRYSDYRRGVHFELVGVDTLWLDPKQQKTPVIRVGFNDPDVLEGNRTEGVLIVLFQSLREMSIQSGFGDGWINGFSARSVDSWKTSFEVDERGLLSPRRHESSEGNQTTTYKWMSNKFKVSERKVESSNLSNLSE